MAPTRSQPWKPRSERWTIARPTVDASARGRARDAALYDSPEARASLLRQWLRSEPLCETCGGTGKKRVAGEAPYACHDHRDGMLSCGPTCGIWRTCSRCAGTGSRLQARIELAAYCGDLGALAALCCPHDDIRDGDRGCICYYARPETPFAAWVARLSRWADVGRAPERAAVAAARHVWARAPRDHGGDRALRLLEGAEAWLSGLGSKRWSDAWGGLSGGAEWCRAWLPTPYDAMPNVHALSVEVCARIAGEQPVREAISSSLIRWALSEEP